MKDFWNKRYSAFGYAYGTSPNEYFKSQIDKMRPGKLLLPAEGEGRNAVYAARKGWEVYAFDFSDEAKKKAMKLADDSGVTIHYKKSDFKNIHYPANSFDMIALIYAHFHAEVRKQYHQKLLEYLKPKGLLIVEGFAKEQIQRNSGGPRNVDVLFSAEELGDDFKSLQNIETKTLETNLSEGFYHQGMAMVVRLRGTKAI